MEETHPIGCVSFINKNMSRSISRGPDLKISSGVFAI